MALLADEQHVIYPHRIDLNSGVGTQVVVGDVNGDNRPDIVVGNKKDTFLFVQRAQSVDQQTGESQQPVATPVKLAPDEYPRGGLSADEAAGLMRLPNGFSVSVFAAEPDVKQPIAMTLDDRGRVWVAEAYEYPRRANNGQGRDRILVFEDTNGDGRFDKRKVFFEGLNLVSGLEVGFGGVWVGAAPYLLFIPDRDGDDLPDGEPQVLLDGWGYQDTHETLNAFIWGPDGWLYGCHGVFTHSRVGRPGTPDRGRVPLNAAVWRYHPNRHQFEVFAHGTSNPWGVDFDDHGQAICTACVIPHLYHVIQGARYQRQAGRHFNRYTYADIKTIADHLHFLGNWHDTRNERLDQVGGGHAHAGAMIYLGNAWPAKYRNHIFMNNIHGQRINTDILKRRGSGFVGHHGPDFLLAQDRASQMLYFRYGPDGQVYIIDWYDMQACHDRNVDVHDRSNGRIYKVSYGKTRPAAVDLKSSSDLQLAELCLKPNDWYVRHARRILQERASARQLDRVARTRLVDIATTHRDVPRRLRAIWALHVSGQMTAELLGDLLGYHSEYVRAWAIQLLLDNQKVESRDFLPRLIDMAKTDDSPVVRLYLASAAGRLPVDDRWEILAGLASHAEDADDHNLPLMVWYAAEPLAEADPDRALAFGLSCGRTIPILREYMMRRIGSLDSTASLATLVRVLGESQDREEQLVVLNGIRHALSGQRRVEPPTDWNRVFSKLMESAGDDVRTRATALGVTFGDQNAMEKVREIVRSRQAPVANRRDALEALLAANDPQLVSTLKDLLDDSVIRDLALRGLAQYDDDGTPAAVLAVYQDLSPAQKRAALATLCARPAYAIAVLKSMAAEKVPVADLSADLVRQLHNLRNPDVDRLIEQVWGRVRTTPADKEELIVRYKRILAAQAEGGADLRLGRAIYAKTCQQCHVLYGVGHDIGPDITGSNRSDVDYLLSNVVDPSALIAKVYLTTIVVTVDGRVVTGVVSAEDDKSVTLRNATETLIIPKGEIDERHLSDTSIMPDDQLRQFSDREVASLFAYLMGTSQTPMLATKDNAALLFNGRDLAGWRGDGQLWSVEEGDIVGRSPGIDHNSFLISDLAAEDFRLTVEVKLVDNVGNSGIQFRSQPIHGFNEVRGYQADIGVDWWGKLYEENGRALLWDKSGEQHLRVGGWNKYEILAQGNHIRTWINGQLCVDLVDPSGSKEGIFALQIHSGGPMEVRFRNLKLEVVDSVTSQ